MKASFYFFLKTRWSKVFATISLLIISLSLNSQCFEDFYVYQIYPYSSLCSPQYATLRAEYYGYGGYGEMRWYTSETDPYSVQTGYIDTYSGYSYNDYTVYATNGLTMWVSFYNYYTGCESFRQPYTFYISTPAYVYEDYATKCNYDVAKVQLSSNISGVTFQLYRYYEYYDPYYGWVQDYQLQQSNSTGYFEIFDFDPLTDQDKYYAKVYQPYGCSTPYYSQLYFEVIGPNPPSITGNLSIISGASTTLSASGNASTFNWYDAASNLFNQGWYYTTPTSLTPNTYTYQVKGSSFDGTCLTDPTSVIVTVNYTTVTYSTTYNSSNFIKTIDLSKPVGTVAGSAGATPTGGVNYSIPIYAPPGTNGVQPSLSIAYNSQAGNGVAGYGWNIAGLSLVSRMGKNIYYNGSVAPVTFTASDAFLLDGMKLNAISGSNGANGTIYASEAESFARIISYTTASADNPDWFQVTAKDGSIMEFGHTADSRISTDNGASVMSWRLNKIIDINGNYIEFIYDNGLRDSRIDEINYTGNAATGLLPYNKIKFNYKSRSDANTVYDAGASLSSKTLLTDITVTNEGQQVRSYQLNYAFDNINSLLKEIIETGNDGSALNSSIFLYGDSPLNFTNESTPIVAGSAIYQTGDFNADGLSDIIEVLPASNDFSCRIYGRSDAASPIQLKYNGTPLSSGQYQLITSNTTFNGSYNQILSASSDYNGDSKEDLLITKTYNISSSLKGLSGIYVFTCYDDLSGFYLFGPGPQMPVGYDGSSYTTCSRYGSSNNYVASGDFDGDGSMDFITMLQNNNGSYFAHFTSNRLNIIYAQINPVGLSVSTVANASGGVQSIDFDGDGKMELLVIVDDRSYVLALKQEQGSYTSYRWDKIYETYSLNKDSKVFYGDFNGDGKTDLLVKNGGSWQTLLATGDSYTGSAFTFNQTVILNGANGDHKIIVTDFNGDGKSDILHAYNDWSVNQGRLSVYYSKNPADASKFYYEQYNYPSIIGNPPVVAGDLNGDGRADFITSTSYTSPYSIVFIKPNGKERLLMKVTDGHNTTSSFDYKLLTDKTTIPYFYNRTVPLNDPANQNPFNYVQLPLYAVSTVTVPDGIGGNNTTSFNYENAVTHRAARGFLGFRKIVAKNVTTDITSITENEINTQFAVPYTVKQTTQLISTSQLLSETQFTNSFVSLSTGSNDIRYLQKVDKTLGIDYLNGSASESVNTYDNYGNIITNISKVGTLSGSTVTANETATTTTAYGIYNTPVPARPTNITVLNERSGMPSLSTTTALTYNANGLLASQTVFSGLPKAVVTSYSYNAVGNRLTAVTSSAGLNNRTATSTYDAKGRFVLSKQMSGSNMSQTETYTYDARWGQPLSQTSSDCLNTTFEYDGFGRLKKTNLPQGYSVNTSLVWDVSGNNVYYAFTDHSGGNPDVKTWYDKLNRETKTQTAGFNNQWLTRITTYNAKGQVATETNDYYPSETPLTTINSYDVYGRRLSTSNALNTITNVYTTLSNGHVQVTTTNSGGQSSTKISDATGKIVIAIDNGGQLDFTYDSRGHQTEVKHGGVVLITSVYDIYGRQTTLTDKNAGTVTYMYDAYGQLTQQTDANNNTYNLVYDDLGRITSRTGPEGATTYEYYVSGSCSNNNPVKITGFNGVLKEYAYDTYKRPATEKVTIDGVSYTTTFTYNTYNALTKAVYPSGMEENRTYDSNGGLLTVTGGNAGSQVTLFTATAVNGFGQYTGFTLGNGKTSQHTFNYGIPTRFYTQGVQDLNFSFDYTKGNLLSRNDVLKNLTETFSYDNQNRLIASSVNGVQQLTLTYDGNTSFSMGNIINKTDAGNYVYKNDKIHAVAYITNPAGAQTPPATISTVEQQITYTPFLKAATITEEPYSLEFTYGPGYERLKTLLKNNNVLQETRLYFGSYEKQIIAGGATREVHYIAGGNGLCAILVKESGVVTPYYIYTDHLGSLLTITNATGTIIAEQNFDAWGRKRNTTNWNYTSIQSVPDWLYRGYTGHEHLPQFAMINMNGRLYDPIQARMLSPDNYVCTPFGTQGYNRYGYAMNNPLTYVDPDGNFLIPILAGALIGAATSAAIYSVSTLVNGGGWTWSGFSRATAIGALSGAIGGGLSDLGKSLGTFGQSMGYGMMTNMVNTAAVNTAFGDPVTFGAMVGAAFGGVLEGTMPQFKGFRFNGNFNFGTVLLNALSEMGINSIRSGIVGGISGGLGALIDGTDPREGVRNGFRNGAIAGGVRTAINIAALGPVIRPSGKAETALVEMESDLGINLLHGIGSPVYRSGGLMKLFGIPGITLGRSLMVTGDIESSSGINTWVHESFHYYQQLTQTWAGQLGRGMYEQWYLRAIRGKPVYNYKLYGNRYNESAAAQYADPRYPY